MVQIYQAHNSAVLGEENHKRQKSDNGNLEEGLKTQKPSLRKATKELPNRRRHPAKTRPHKIRKIPKIHKNPKTKTNPPSKNENSPSNPPILKHS